MKSRIDLVRISSELGKLHSHTFEEHVLAGGMCLEVALGTLNDSTRVERPIPVGGLSMHLLKQVKGGRTASEDG